MSSDEPAARDVAPERWQLAFQAGATAWPGVNLTWTRFLEHVRSLPLDLASPDAHPGDLYVAVAALQGDPVAVAALEERFIRPARTSVERVHRATDFVDDVMQELRRKLLLPPDRRLARYGGKSPLAGWIRVTAARLAYDVARADPFRVRFDTDRLEGLTAVEADPDLEILRRTLGGAFQLALRETLAALSARERNLLRMHVLQGLSIDALARPYGIHRATAARWLEAIRKKVLDGVREHVLRRHGRLSEAELDSLQRLVVSDLRLSLGSVATAAT